MKKLRLPLRFRSILLERFTFVGNFYRDNMFMSGANVPCPLCAEYKICRNCPARHCDEIIRDILGEQKMFGVLFNFVRWYPENSDKVRKQLKKIRRYLRERVEWYDDTTSGTP